MDARFYVVTAWEKEGIPAHRGGGLVSRTDASARHMAALANSHRWWQRIQRPASGDRLTAGVVFECWRWGLTLRKPEGVLALQQPCHVLKPLLLLALRLMAWFLKIAIVSGLGVLAGRGSG